MNGEMNRSDPKLHFGARLRRWMRRSRRRLLWGGMLRFAAAGGGAAVLAVWALGGKQEPGALIATGLSLSLAVCLLVLAWRFLAVPWRRLRRRRDLVGAIESRERCSNLLVSAEEAVRRPDRWPAEDAIARELQRRLFVRAADTLDRLDPARVFPIDFLGWTAAGAVLAALLGAWLVFGVPDEGARGLGRLLRPAPAKLAPPSGGLYAAAGPDFVVAGEDYEAAALDFSGGDGNATLEIRARDGSWRSLAARRDLLVPAEIGLPAPGRRWSAVLEAVHDDFAWRFRRGTLVTGEREVRVRHHPLLTELGARILSPAYTDLPGQDLVRLPSWIEVPAGSTVRLAGEANQPVETARLVTTDADTVLLSIDGARVSGELPVAGDVAFRIELENGFGLVNLSPVEHEIAAAPDEVPVAHLERPDDDGVLPIEGELALRVEAADDFGLDGLDLLARVISETGAAAGEGADAGWRGGSFWPGGAAAGDGWIELETGAGSLGVRPQRPDPAGGRLIVRLDLDVRAGGLDLVAGDILELVVEARDNRRPLPAGTGRSNVLRLALPSAAEVLAGQAEASETQRRDLEEMRRRSGELAADLDRLNRELMKNPLPDWARQQEMEAALQRQQALQEELARVAEGVREELDRLAENQLTTGEMLDKADEVAALLDRSFSDQLEDLLEKLQDPSGRAESHEVARAIRELARDQKEMARRLDAALAMMDRMSREQELEGLTAMLEKMMRRQQELAEASRRQAGDESGEKSGEDGEESDPDGEQSESDESESGSETADGQPENSESSQEAGESEPSPEELARRQEALSRELEQLKERMQEALEQQRSDGDSGQTNEEQQQYEEMLSEAIEKLEEQIEQGDMSGAAEQLAQMDPQTAAQMQQQAMRDLGALYHVLMKSQQAMQAALQAQQITSLRGLAADLLSLSARQEAISASIPLQLRDVATRDLTRGQHRLQKSAAGVRDELAELLDDSPQQIMALLRKLDDLIEEMGRTVQAMNEERGPTARRHASGSLAQANRIVIQLLTQAQMSASSSGGSGNPMPSASEKLQELAREQSGVNGLTEQIREMLANRGLSQEVRSQMKRLGEAQGDLAAQLQELDEKERTNPEGERILGDLHELGQRMESISRELDDGLVSEETLVRQERILGRLLDARNSVRRRDWSTRRESRTADALYEQQLGRGADGDQEDETSRRLRLQPLRLAPLEYRDLVRRYFSALDSLRRLDDGPRGGDLP